MDKRALRLGVSAAALAAPLLVASLAHADDADPAASQATATAPAEATVAPLMITAERRTTNLQVTPLAATVISGSQLQSEGIQNVDDLQFHTPSLVVADFGQGALFNIRGLGKDLTNVQTPSGVVTYYDGVAQFPGFFLNAPYYDLANVEVLRGPQGTFAGQNADAGAVFITTNDAHLGSFSGDIQGQYGTYSDARVQGFLNVPLGDTLAARVSVNFEQRDTFYKLSGPYTTPSGRQPGALQAADVRLAVLWEPTPQFRVDLKASYDYVDAGGYLADTTLNPANPAQLNPGDPFRFAAYADDYGTNKGERIVLNAAYTFADGIVLKSISGYQQGGGNGNEDLLEIGPGSNFEDYGRESTYSEELNLVSPDKGPLRWLGGLYYQHDYVTLLPGGGQPGFDIHVVVPGVGFEDLDLIYRTPKVTQAVFGQVSYDITPALQLQVGLRYTDESFGLRDDSPTIFDGVVLLSDLAYTAHTSDRGVTGKVALNWKLDDNNFLYAFVATGRKAAGINTTPAGTDTAPEPFGPETVTDYEFGWKPTFADGHMRGQFGFYYDQYKDFQLSFGTPDEPTMSFIRNAGGTTTLYGVEAEVQAVFGALSFDAGGSYEHSSLGATLVADPVTAAAVQLGGRTAPLAPAWTLNFGAQYAFALSNGATLTPRVDVSYTSSQWATPYQDLGDFLPSRALVNTDLEYRQGKFKATLYATNATNLHYIIATNVGLRYAGNPGQYGIRLEQAF
ncbi:MAG TPA: TonB-dependent receptor [Caulobacteraceae bacterium]|jgi:iron complex outermembrane receptor protein|nr:TonB-dependent receptor [Caulobacteraceae bacterium]